MSKTAFLIFRPVMDYEESIEPYLICPTKAQAEYALAYIREKMEDIAKHLPLSPEKPERCTDDANAKWEYACQKARNKFARKFAKIEWPLGIEGLQQDAPQPWDSSFTYDPWSVQMMELPVASEPLIT
jgi:hypothetical protein